MPKKEEELETKEITKLKAQIQKMSTTLGSNVKDLEQKFSGDQKNLDELLNALETKVENNQTNMNEKIKQLQETMSKNLSDKIGELHVKVNQLNEDFTHHKEQVQILLKNQEEILLSIVNKFKEEFKKNKTKIDSAIEQIRAEQDTLKISFTINESKILEAIKTNISKEMQDAVRGKEKEVLMNIWIEELRKVASDFEKLKKMKPKEFELQISEIVEVIEAFREKLKK